MLLRRSEYTLTALEQLIMAHHICNGMAFIASKGLIHMFVRMCLSLLLSPYDE